MLLEAAAGHAVACLLPAQFYNGAFRTVLGAQRPALVNNPP